MSKAAFKTLWGRLLRLTTTVRLSRVVSVKTKRSKASRLPSAYRVRYEPCPKMAFLLGAQLPQPLVPGEQVLPLSAPGVAGPG